MKTLRLYSLESIDHIVSPTDFDQLSLRSPALDVFTDFKNFKPLIIDEDTKAVDAHILMERAHVALKIVIDKNGEFSGIIGLDDLSDEILIKNVSLGVNRGDILVSDLMKPRNQIYAFDYEQLTHVWVMDVIEALKKWP
jgi:CBS domain-containing protein